MTMTIRATAALPALFANPVDMGNLLFDTDSYKYSHARQHPDGTEYASSYVEARRPHGQVKVLTFFGLQMELAALRGVVITHEKIDEALPFLKAHGLDLYAEGWRRIVDEHGGKLPVLIEALPEGTQVAPGIPMLRICNTAPGLAWLPSFLETRLLRRIWYATSVASTSHWIVERIAERMLITDGHLEGLRFKLHDFGARGTSVLEAAATGGVAHLVNSCGTDTAIALVAARNYYGAEMAGFSIPATEHSTMTALGREGEAAQMERLLDLFPAGLVACVSDSYDLMHAVRNIWGRQLRDKVLARDGVLVIRPDSGLPEEIVPDVIEALMERFGYEMTVKGYKLLNPKVRVIQGDGITMASIVRIMDVMIERGLAIGNIAFGVGGALLQGQMRDDFGFAMKASALQVDGVWRDIWKDPITAKGSKTSKRGVQGAMRSDSGGWVARRAGNIPPGADRLTPVFRDGDILRLQTLDEIRAQAWPDGF